MRINDQGLALIKHFEGLSLIVYKDAVGLATVGYGHCDRGMAVGSTISIGEANRLLIGDLQRTEDGVSRLLTAAVTSNQFSALVCFAFNVGVANLASSTLLRKVNNRDSTAADEFLRWNRAGGQVLVGLTKRREAERVLFMS